MSSSSACCSICAESYGSDTICSTICGHIFHEKCLALWLQRSNTCPLCTRTDPRPHRIYLDFPVIEETSKVIDNSKAGENSNANQDGHVVVLKNAHHLTLPPHNLLSAVKLLILVMKVPISERNIGEILEIDNAIHVNFKSAHHQALFLKNKYKLKNNPETSVVRIHELLDAETEELLHYSFKLKSKGYNFVFVQDGKVFAKKAKNSEEMEILSKDHVNTLCYGDTSISTSREPSRSARTKANRRPPKHSVTDQRPQNTVTNGNMPQRQTKREVGNNNRPNVSTNRSNTTTSLQSTQTVAQHNPAPKRVVTTSSYGNSASNVSGQGTSLQRTIGVRSTLILPEQRRPIVTASSSHINSNPYIASSSNRTQPTTSTSFGTQPTTTSTTYRTQPTTTSTTYRTQPTTTSTTYRTQPTTTSTTYGTQPTTTYTPTRIQTSPTTYRLVTPPSYYSTQPARDRENDGCTIL
ncbi:uncharacterized protein LOC106083891 [Stomoxys calcitrans]|uniref:RING-type domain-containing protein n=1 Tax=Stomoxys calcitrans TaxID=35570 RepID=A0A1I8QAZ3_STOCA|nr:uncharacterized protein LOC106083891 [Stomoxys calcitrans]